VWILGVWAWSARTNTRVNFAAHCGERETRPDSECTMCTLPSGGARDKFADRPTIHLATSHTALCSRKYVKPPASFCLCPLSCRIRDNTILPGDRCYCTWWWWGRGGLKLENKSQSTYPTRRRWVTCRHANNSRIRLVVELPLCILSIMPIPTIILRQWGVFHENFIVSLSYCEFIVLRFRSNAPLLLAALSFLYTFNTRDA